MSFKKIHIQPWKQSTKLFEKHFFHLLVTDIASLIALFLLFAIIVHTLTLTVNNLSPLAEDILAYQNGSINQETLTDNIISYKGLVQDVLGKSILILTAGFFALNALLSLFRGLAWSFIKKHKFTLQDFWKLFKVHLIYTGSLVIIAFIIGMTIEKTSVTVGAILLVFFVFLIIHFTPIMYSAFNPKMSVWKNIGVIYHLGIKNVHHYLLFHVVSVGVIFILLIIIYLLQLISSILSSIAFIVALYLYWVWYRNHHVQLAKVLQ